jgi:histone H1/5
VQYMVRRGQMTQDEADKLIREAEEADGKRKPHPVPPPSKVPKPPPAPILKVDPVPSSFVATTMAKAPVRSEPARSSAPVAAAAPKKPPAKAKKKAASRPAPKSKPAAKSASKKKPAGRR